MRRRASLLRQVKQAWNARYVGAHDEEHGPAVHVGADARCEPESLRLRGWYGVPDYEGTGWGCELAGLANGALVFVFPDGSTAPSGIPIAALTLLTHGGKPIRSGGDGQRTLGGESAAELREDRQVGMEPDSIEPTDAERQE